MCALVTGVQTCALPIWAFDPALEYHRALVRRRAGADPQHAASRRSGRSDRGSVHDSAQTVERRSARAHRLRSEEHTSELQSLMRISYAVFCLKKKNSFARTQQTNTRRKTRKYTTYRTLY